MVKNDLREQGFSVSEKYPKQSVIAAIWLISAIFIIAGTLVSKILIETTADNEFLDFFDDIALTINNLFHTNGATSLIYLILWFFIGATFYFIVKSDSRTKKMAILRAVFIILTITLIFSFMILIAQDYNNPAGKASAFFGIFEFIFYTLSIPLSAAVIVVMVVLFEMIHLVLKLAVMIVFSRNKKHNISFKIIRGMPVCSSQEAFKPWNIIFIYILPFVFVYSVILILNIRNEFEYLIINTFLAFFLAFDLPVALYALFFKVKNRIDYIALDHYIYEVSLFKKSYIKEKN